MKKNLLIYVEDPRFGGPHQFTLNILDYLKSDFNISVLFSNIESQIFLKKIKLKKIKYDTFHISFLSLELFRILKYILYFFFEVYKIRNYLKKKRIDIIYSISGFYSVKIIIASLFLRIKIVTHFHDTFCNLIFLYLGYFTRSFIDLFVFSSKKSFLFYRKFIGEKKYLIIQSGIYVKDENKINAKKSKVFNIVSISNINPIKGIEFLLEISKKFKDRNIKFHLIGNVWKSQMKYYKKIREKAKLEKLSNIKFYSQLNKEKIRKILLNSDLYLCLSKYESSPMAVWEAMSYSLPVITTDVGDLAYFNKIYKFGFIIKRKNIKNVQEKILSIYFDRNLKKKLGQNSKKFVLERIDLKKNINNFQKELSRI